jgi:hypothetical protein
MPYEVELAVRVEEALDGLPEHGRQEVMEVIAAALVRPDSWPLPGCWGAMHIPPRSEGPHNGRYDFAGEDVAV